jgi:chromosome segregation ATPase
MTMADLGSCGVYLRSSGKVSPMSDPTENPTGLVKILDALQEIRRAQTGVSASVEKIVSDLPKIIALVQAKFDQFGSEQVKTRAEIMDRIDRLQGTVELVRDDARVNWATADWATADTAINRARNSREDIDHLQKQITAMQRRYQTLEAVLEELRKSEDKKPDTQ